MFLLKKVFEFREKTHSDHEKPFLAHLEDLRVLITRMALTLIVATVGCFFLQEDLMSILRAPAEKVLYNKQLEHLPKAKDFNKIRIPSVEDWSRAKEIERISSRLKLSEREMYLAALDDAKAVFHAESVALLRAVKDLKEADQVAFIKSLKTEPEMQALLLALWETDPSVDADSGSNIRMMSALKPTETFVLSMKLAFFAGVIISFPLLLLYILQFVLPGLHQKEKRMLWPAMAIGFGLFLGGVAFAYFLVLPRALAFFHDWSSSLGVSNDWRIGEYITFATRFTLLFGLSFELPVVVMLFVKLGMLTYEMMSKTRAYAIVGIFILAAVITPTPDAMTMALMALPMLILYEICIWLAWFDRKKNRKEEAAEEAEMVNYRRRKMLAPAIDEDPEEIEEAGDHGYYGDEHHDDFHDDYHDGRYYHDASDSDEVSESDKLEGAEEWTQPDDSVTGDGEENPPSKDLGNKDEK